MRPNWFVGLPVDPGRWLERLLANAPSSLRSFHPDELHITVAFLGGCGEAAALVAWATGRRFARKPILARLGELRGFGNPRRPSALSAVLAEGHEDTVALIAELRGPMVTAAGARPDDRSPLPHVTVARPTRSARPPERRAALEWARSKGRIDAQVTLNRLALYTWSDDRRSRQFRIVEEHIFGH